MIDNNEWLNNIIKKLLSIEKCHIGTSAGLEISEIQQLCQKSREIFLEQPILLELRPPLTVVGDIHGQYYDLLRIFNKCGYPPKTNYLFLGDYVDRGYQSIECICLLFAYKIKYPLNFFLLRGNHECFYINREFGFYDECVSHYSIRIWQMFCDVFNCLPVCSIIDETIFCVHGGISPSLTSLDQILEYDSQRPFSIQDSGIICDFEWSDPSNEVDEWEENDRGASYVFGHKPLQEFLKKFNFDLVVRAHQAIMSGYDFPFSDHSLLTIFSAPNYCNEYNNKGAVLQINEELICSFCTFKPIHYDSDEITGRPGTPPRGTSDGPAACYDMCVCDEE